MQRNLRRFSALAAAMLTGPVRTVVELGARDCRETRDFAALYPAARILALECNPDTLPVCRAAASGLPNVELIEAAAGDRAGPAAFYAIDTSTAGAEAADPGRSSLYRIDEAYGQTGLRQRETTVQVVRVGDLLRERGIASVDLLWMDIQGAELSALRGFGEHLASVALVHTEVEFLPLYRGQPLFAELRAHLEAQGFAFVGFTEYHRADADAVFANRRRTSAIGRLRALLGEPVVARKRLTWLRHRLKRRLGAR